MSEEVIKNILSLGIQLLSKLIPGLGSLLGMPIIGWVAGIAIGYLTKLLYQWIDRLIRFGAIDEQVRLDLEPAKEATIALKQAQDKSVEERIKALEQFKITHSKLSRINIVRKNSNQKRSS